MTSAAECSSRPSAGAGTATTRSTGWARLQARLDAGDPNGEATTAWMVAQELILLYRRSRDLPDAKHRLYRLLVHRLLLRCADSNIPELHRLARTLDGWRHELLAYFTTGRVSNGSTEAVNLLIKRIKRIGFGFRT